MRHPRAAQFPQKKLAMTAILEQRRIEAAVINPLVEAFEQGLGRRRTRKILAGVIKQLAFSCQTKYELLFCY